MWMEGEEQEETLNDSRSKEWEKRVSEREADNKEFKPKTIT